MQLKYYTVNAFTDTSFQGTQVLVFPDANELDTSTMHEVAKEFGFPDTVFITNASSPDCQARFRVFTKYGETDFEGHATIAAAYVLNQDKKLLGEENSISIFIEEGTEKLEIYFHKNQEGKLITEFVLSEKARVDSYVPSIEELSRILSIDTVALALDEFKPLVTSCKKTYLVVPVRKVENLLNAKFSLAAWFSSSSTSTLPSQLFVFSPEYCSEKSEFYARIMGDNIPADEDPPIGSAMPAFANYLLQSKYTSEQYVVKRGVGHDRLSTLNVQIESINETLPVIRVGGRVTEISTGTMCI